MKLSAYLLPALVIAALLGTVLVSQLTGNWSTTGRNTVIPTTEAGNLSSSGIKGWMTLAQVSETYNIPLEELYTRLHIPADIPAETALKELEPLVPDFEVSTVRTMVDEYLAEK